MLELKKTFISGVFEILMPRFDDQRGGFVKVFQDSIWKQSDIDFVLKESYYSVSKKDVIRGMHFQVPPFQHHKIVYCPKGSIVDVAVDLRKDSPTFGQFFETVLSAQNHKGLFIPEGCAHGFKSLEDDTITVYYVSSEYERNADSGILWDSFDMDWDCAAPILSERDKGFEKFEEYNSPF